MLKSDESRRFSEIFVVVFLSEPPPDKSENIPLLLLCSNNDLHSNVTYL